MFELKNIVALLVAAHGIGFSLWFLASWVPAAKVVTTTTTPHWLLSSEVGIGDPVGRITGLLAVAVMVGFLAVAWGIFTGAVWWAGLAVTTSVVSLIAIVIPWWSVVPPFSAIGATLVDLAVIGFAVLPAWNDALATAPVR